MRPGLLRGARAGDAVALAGRGASLLAGGGGAAGASKPGGRRRLRIPPSPAPALAYEAAAGRAVVEAGGKRTELPGTDPAIGGPGSAVIRDGRVEVIERVLGRGARGRRRRGRRRRRDQQALAGRPPPRRRARRDRGRPRSASRARPGKLRRVAARRRAPQLSRPALSGNTARLHRGQAARSALLRAHALGGQGEAAPASRSSKTLSFTGPSVAGARIAYVETSRKRQTVRVTKGGGSGNVVLRRGSGPPTLWTTALAQGPRLRDRDRAGRRRQPDLGQALREHRSCGGSGRITPAERSRSAGARAGRSPGRSPPSAGRGASSPPRSSR